MGVRGPLPVQRSRRGQARGGSVELAVVERALPETPDGLGDAGAATWGEAWACEWAQASDEGSILHLAHLEDERAAIRAAIGETLTFEKVLVSPRGDVVGSEMYANPLLRELRRLDAPIQTLRDRLGLSPVARARLGQAVVQLRKDENDLKRKQIMDGYRQSARK